MATNQTNNFKDPFWATAWLDVALKKEKEKYAKCPVMPDMVPGYEAAQGWGYAVVGYFLVEESFKALLNIRGKEVPKTHSLSSLFNLFDQDDKKILREYYDDYRATIGGHIGKFPFESLDDYLVNLDGDKNRRGDHIGSFDWRYFPIEERKGQKMPLVSVDYLHEIVLGCIQIEECADNGRFDTRSWRMHHERIGKYSDWLEVRMNSDGWDDLGDRLEILWGPDYQGRYDLYLFRDKSINVYFSEIPTDLELPIVDKRGEIETSAHPTN